MPEAAAAPAGAPAAAPAAAPGTMTSTIPTGTPTPASAPIAAGDWTSGYNEEQRGYLQNKGFKGHGDVLDSYTNLEKLMGAPKERLLRLPDKADAPEWGDIYAKLGRPAVPTEYQIQGEKGSEPFVKWAQESFHELGLSRAQGEKLANKWGEYVNNANTQQQEAFAARVAAEDKVLRKEWGAAYDQNVLIGRQAFKAFGMQPEMIDKLEQSMGFAGTMKFMQQLGAKIGEDKFIQGNGPGGGPLTPEAARNKIAALRGDNDFIKRYAAGDVTAREEFERLHKFAYPEMNE